MASPTQWTWVWVDSGSWWWTGRPGVLRFMGSQRVGQDWVTELNWKCSCVFFFFLSLNSKINISKRVEECGVIPLTMVLATFQFFLHLKCTTCLLSSSEWDTVPPGSLPGLRLGLVGEWRSGEEREDEDSFPAPLSFAMLLWEAALLQTRARLCGTSSHSNNPSVQNVNSFLFANLWPPQPLLFVLLTLPILLLLDGFLWKNGMIFLPGPWLIQTNSYSNASFQKPPSQKKSPSMTIALKHMPWKHLWTPPLTHIETRLPCWLGERVCLQCSRHRRRGLHPWVRKTPWIRAWKPTPAFLPEESHGQRSLVGYSP